MFAVLGKGPTLFAGLLDPFDHGSWVDPFVCGNFFSPVDGPEQGLVGEGQGIRKTVLKNIGHGGVAAWLETSDDSTPRPTGPQGFQSPLDWWWV